jgi:peptide deformylase
MRIIKNKDYLRKKVTNVPPKEECDEIVSLLFKELSVIGGFSLSANQIGINARICVVKVKEPIYFINPVISWNGDDRISYCESCLSIPRRNMVKTVRFKEIKIKSDNFD